MASARARESERVTNLSCRLLAEIAADTRPSRPSREAGQESPNAGTPGRRPAGVRHRYHLTILSAVGPIKLTRIRPSWTARAVAMRRRRGYTDPSVVAPAGDGSSLAAMRIEVFGCTTPNESARSSERGSRVSWPGCGRPAGASSSSGSAVTATSGSASADRVPLPAAVRPSLEFIWLSVEGARSPVRRWYKASMTGAGRRTS